MRGSVILAPDGSSTIYLTKDFEPTTSEQADIVKVTLPNGRVRFGYRLADMQEAFDPAKHPRGRAGRFAPTGKSAPSDVKKAVGEKPSKTFVAVKSMSKQPTFTGTPVFIPKAQRYSKSDTGKVAEAIIVEYLRSLGFKDARALKPSGKSNYAIDGMFGNTVYDVKGGLISNSTRAQQWRLTIGEPSDAEKSSIARMAMEERREYNAGKSTRIVYRKNQATQEIANATGKTLKTATFTTILNPKTGRADVFKFDGFHARVDWRSAHARQAYVGTVSYSLRGKIESAQVARTPVRVLTKEMLPDALRWWIEHTNVDLSKPYNLAAVVAFEPDLEQYVHDYGRQIAQLVTQKS